MKFPFSRLFHSRRFRKSRETLLSGKDAENVGSGVVTGNTNGGTVGNGKAANNIALNGNNGPSSLNSLPPELR